MMIRSRKKSVWMTRKRKDLTVKGQFCRVEISKKKSPILYQMVIRYVKQTDLEIKSISENFPGSKCNQQKSNVLLKSHRANQIWMFSRDLRIFEFEFLFRDQIFRKVPKTIKSVPSSQKR